MTSAVMKKMLPTFLLLTFLLTGCATTSSGPTPERTVEIIAEKSIPSSEYAMTGTERTAALRVFRQMRAHMLFEIVVNRAGNVEKVRVTRSSHDDYSTAAFKSQVATTTFPPASREDPNPYRTFFFPLKIETSIRKQD